MMNYQLWSRNLIRNLTKSLAILACTVALLFANNAAVHAAPIHVLAANGWGNQITGRAEQDAGTVQRNIGKASSQSEGISKQVSGRAKQDIGRTQTAIDNAGKDLKKQADRVANKTEALQRQAKGKAIQDVGKTQDALQASGNKIEDATSNAIESVKDFFQ